MSSQRPAPSTFRLEIFLVSFSAIVLEIALTRVFSYKLYYYFTYLILGIAMLGLGSGGVLVALVPALRRAGAERLVALGAVAAALAVPVALAVVAFVQLNTADLASHPSEALKLAALCLALFAPFLGVGVCVAKILGARAAQVHALYFADLVGAGLGCAACVPLFVAITPPGAIALAGLLLALVGLRLASRAARPAALVALPLAVGLAALVAFPGRIPDPVPDRIKSMSPQRKGDSPVLFSRWSALFRIDVLEGVTPDRYLILAHDGMLGSTIRHYEGDPATLGDFDSDVRSLPFSVLPLHPDVLIIGAAGGNEILASLHFGARRITAVELNPVTVSLLRGEFAEYSGRIADDPRVELVNGEGRAFVEREHSPRDLIWYVAPDSYSALNAATSGAFVLSESYLYTVEMIGTALSRLAPGGVVCAQFGEVVFDRKPNRTARYLATAREAFRELGISDFSRRVLLATAPGVFTTATVLLGREPFTPEEAARFVAQNGRIRGARVWHAAGLPVDAPHHPVHEVIGLPEPALQAWLAKYPYDVGPVRDDSPFFWHFARYRDALTRPWGQKPLIWDFEDATGERMLVTLLGFAVAFAGVFLLLPLLLAREVWREVPYKARAALYFAALGLGFMLFEVSLIQKLTLFLGFPTYSLTVTLFSLLVASGVGSLGSRRLAGRRNHGFAALLLAIALLAVLYETALPSLFAALGDAGLPERAGLAVLLLAPLGLCLGAFFPLGLRSVASLGERGADYVAWAWAVNGFFSVVSSVLATILSMTLGFRAVLALAVGVYALGIAAFARVPEPSGPEPARGPYSR